jgi:hypothetical protein
MKEDLIKRKITKAVHGMNDIHCSVFSSGYFFENFVFCLSLLEIRMQVISPAREVIDEIKEFVWGDLNERIFN